MRLDCASRPVDAVDKARNIQLAPLVLPDVVGLAAHEIPVGLHDLEIVLEHAIGLDQIGHLFDWIDVGRFQHPLPDLRRLIGDLVLRIRTREKQTSLFAQLVQILELDHAELGYAVLTDIDIALGRDRQIAPPVSKVDETRWIGDRLLSQGPSLDLKPSLAWLSIRCRQRGRQPSGLSGQHGVSIRRH